MNFPPKGFGILNINRSVTNTAVLYSQGRTSVKKNSYTPVWNEQIVFENKIQTRNGCNIFCNVNVIHDKMWFPHIMKNCRNSTKMSTKWNHLFGNCFISPKKFPHNNSSLPQIIMSGTDTKTWQFLFCCTLVAIICSSLLMFFNMIGYVT